MKRLISILFLFIIFATFTKAFVQTEEARLSLFGLVMDQDSLPLPGAHIIIDGARGTTADEEGRFALIVAPLDTLNFGFLGYHDFILVIPQFGKNMQLYQEIILLDDTVKLEEVKVYPWPSRDGFENAFKGLEVKDESIDLNTPEIIEDKSVTNVGAGGIGLSSIFKYKKFYKDEYQKKEVNEWKRQERKRQYVDARFKWVVSQVTDLNAKDNKVVTDFRAQCKIKDDFIAEASDYELSIAVKKCYEHYIKDKS